MSCRSEKTEVDRLSNMPEDVLSHILSIMPTKYAVRTSILSKSWSYLWMSVTSLDFDDIQPNHRLDSITECVDRVLKLCTTSQVKLFRLPFANFLLPRSSVSRWIREAVRLNVHELDMQVKPERGIQVIRPIEMPVSLFTCKTKTKLRLHSMIHEPVVWNLSSPVKMPCLKTLEVDLFEEHPIILFKLIHGCPLLESLTLEIAWYDKVYYLNDDDDDDVGDDDEKEYNINIPTLKQLELTILHHGRSFFKVNLNVPSLQYLFVGGYGEPSPGFVIEDLPFLVEATIDFDGLDYLESVNLLRGIRAAESLSWYLHQPIYTSEFPIFSNLKCLEVKYDIDLNEVCEFLQSAPELEYLSIYKCTVWEKEEDECCWIDPPSIPTCMLTNLRTLHVAQGHLHIQFLKYMLGNAKVLKTLTFKQLYLSQEEGMEPCARLLKLPRASRYCEVHFV